MAKGVKGLLLAIVGAFLFWPAGPFWASVGWFLGSTIGSFLDLEDSHNSTMGTRVTDFKSMNSKYGIAIPRGYGCVRHASNIIWMGGVVETEQTTTQCIKTPGFLGISFLGETTSCQTTTQFKYAQSAAFAFSEGPCTNISKLWADGKLIYDNTSGGVVTIVTQGNTPGTGWWTGTPTSPFKFYFGSLTQTVDPTIEAELGVINEAYAFRSIVYVVVNNLDLELFGYRLPVITAEVCYDGSTPSVTNTTLNAPILGDTSAPDFEVLGTVYGTSYYTVGANSGPPSLIVVHNMLTGEVVREREYLFDAIVGGAGLPLSFIAVKPGSDNVFQLIRKYQDTDGNFYFGPYGISTGFIYYGVSLPASDFDQVSYGTYNPITGQLIATFDGGGCAFFPETPFGVSLIFWYRSSPGNADLNYATEEVIAAFTNGGATTDLGKEVFVIPNGDVFWMVEGVGGVWVNRVTQTEASTIGVQVAPTFTRIRFNDGTNITSAANWIYNGQDDSFIFNVDVAGTSPTGLYKVLRSEIDAAGATLDLPLSTDSGRYLNVVPNDETAFQVGPNNGELKAAKDSSDLYVIDLNNMTLTDTVIGVPGGLGTIGTITIPSTGTVRGGSYNVPSFLGFAGAGSDLDYVISDLLLSTDGDDRVRLVADDIDVTDLAGITVRGYPLMNQQTIRNAITPLQQTFFFDVVESDGKIKFVKRGNSSSFTIPEDDLAAHEYGKTSNTKLVPLEYERKSEIELPREIAVRYTDTTLDYNQGVQRARRTQTDSDTNTSMTLPILMTPDEAAQIADIVLNLTWSERVAPFKFETSIKYAEIEATDTGILSMNDGKSHFVRIIGTNFGANGMVEYVAATEYTAAYTSTAVGETTDNGVQALPNGQTVVRVFDVPIGFIDGAVLGQPSVVAGLGMYGSTYRLVQTQTLTYQIVQSAFEGGSISVRDSSGSLASGGSVSADQPMTFGISVNQIGHPNGPKNANVFDYETVITMQSLGGPDPTSRTEAEALTGGQEGYLIVGREIIGFTNVTRDSEVTTNGLDISFNSGTSSIDSTSTDFVAAGFTSGMPLRILGSPGNTAATYWEISSVTTNQIVLTTAPVTESAGPLIVITRAGEQCIFSGGLLRGLFGTENYMYHEPGERITWAANLIAVPIGTTSTNTVVTAYGTPIGGGEISTDSTDYQARALRPWSPVDVTAAESVLDPNDMVISWVRRDKHYGKGFTPTTDVVANSDLDEYEIDILDGYTEGNEYGVIRTINRLSNFRSGNSFTYSDAEQTIDFGAVREEPILVDVYQMSAAVGRGFRQRTVVDRDSAYTPAGEDFGTETAGGAYSLGTGRLNAGSNLIEASGVISANALRLATTVDTEYTAVSFDQAAAVYDIDVLTVMEMQAGTLADINAGVILRGQGSSNADLYGMIIGLGGSSNNVFGVGHVTAGTANAIVTQSVTFPWSTGTAYAIRARYYHNRVQAKVWAYGTPEPGAWQIDLYDRGRGPEYGWVGPFAYNTSNDPLFHYFSWAHRGLRAA